MEATTTPASVGRSRAEILADLDELYRATVNACRDVNAVTYKRYRPDGSGIERVCVTNPLDLRNSGRQGVSAGRSPLPTQRCTLANPTKSDKAGI